MLIYNYHPDSGEFVGASEANANPVKPGEFLIPAHATESEPPQGPPSPGHALVWQDDAWGEVADHRGETWWTPEGVSMEIRKVGDPLEHGLLRERPVRDPPQAATVRWALVSRGVVIQTIEWDSAGGRMVWQSAPDCQMLLDEDGEAVIGEPFGPEAAA